MSIFPPQLPGNQHRNGDSDDDSLVDDDDNNCVNDDQRKERKTEIFPKEGEKGRKMTEGRR